MKINQNSWHYRLYNFMAQWHAVWLVNYDYLNAGKPTNGKIGLCPYMRTILIWGPLAILSNLVPFGMLYLTFFVIPIELNGAMGVYWLFGVLVGLIITVVLIILLSEYQENRRNARMSQVKNQDEAEQDQSDSFWSLVKEYLVSLKTRICPVLEVDDNDKR